MESKKTLDPTTPKRDPKTVLTTAGCGSEDSCTIFLGTRRIAFELLPPGRPEMIAVRRLAGTEDTGTKGARDVLVPRGFYLGPLKDSGNKTHVPCFFFFFFFFFLNTKVGCFLQGSVGQFKGRHRCPKVRVCWFFQGAPSSRFERETTRTPPFFWDP